MLPRFYETSCDRVSAQLLEYAAERLTSEEAASVDGHLEICARCRTQAAECRRALALAANATGRPLPVSRTTWSDLRAELARTEQNRPPAIWRSTRTWQWTGAGVVAVGGLFCLIQMYHNYDGESQRHMASFSVNRLKTADIATPQPANLPEQAHLPVALRHKSGRPGGREHAIAGSLIHRNQSLRNRNLQTTPALQIASNSKASSGRPLPAVQDDILYLNGSGDRWEGSLPALSKIQRSLIQREVEQVLAQSRNGDSFVALPVPQIAGGDQNAVRAALAAFRQQANVVDARLARKVRIAVKTQPLGTLFRQLTEDTGIQMEADARVADDNVTLFCNPRPLRDIMRLIGEHFGFQWQREGEPGNYRYILTQSLRSQLLEEELRNQDQDEALVALDRAMQRYQRIRGLDTSRVQALAATLKPRDAVDLFPLAAGGWVPVNLYFGLSAEELQALRSGHPLTFSMSAEGGQGSLPVALRPEILKAFEEVRINPHPGASGPPLMSHNAPADSLPLSAAKEILIDASLELDRKQLGTYTLKGDVSLHVTTANAKDGIGHGMTLAEVTSPALSSPQNALANQKHAKDPDLQRRVSIEPRPSCTLEYGNLPDVEGISQMVGKKATSGDVLEAIFRATGRDVIGDSYTHLYAPAEVTVNETRLFDGLNRLGDTMHARWVSEAGWLKFRSIRWFYERPQEVPARKLAHWAESRRAHGALTIDDLCEIGQLSNTQLDSLTTYQGALARYDLKEWNFARSTNLREHWRFLGRVPAELRQETLKRTGLRIEQLPPALQRRFIPLALDDPLTTLRPGNPETAAIDLRIEYAPFTHQERPVMPANPVVFIYTYGRAEGDFGRRNNLIGPFNGIFGGSESMTEARRR